MGKEQGSELQFCDMKSARHQSYRDLRTARLRVYPINPTADEVLGDKCYPTIEALPVKPDVVDTVVPPKITEEIVKTCEKLGINRSGCNQGQNLMLRLISASCMVLKLSMESA